MSTAIEFNHVGKQYRLGLVSTKTLSHNLNRWWQKIFRWMMLVSGEKNSVLS